MRRRICVGVYFTKSAIQTVKQHIQFVYSSAEADCCGDFFFG